MLAYNQILEFCKTVGDFDGEKKRKKQRNI